MHTNIYLPMIQHNHSDNTSETSHSSKQRDYLIGLAENKSSLLMSINFKEFLMLTMLRSLK